jgi:hypothetical protein
LSQNEINSLDFPQGILLEATPSQTSLDSIIGMQKILYMMQQYPCRFAFEIWKDKGFGFNFFSSSKSVEGMLAGQLRSVYPQTVVKKSKANIPRLMEGDYVSSCSLSLYGAEFNLRCPEDFHYDPLLHVIEAMNQHNSKIIIQILFERIGKIPKDKRIVLTQKYDENFFFRDRRLPIMKCLIRISSLSEDSYKAREAMEHVSRTFSVFDSDRCQLSPDLMFYPLIENSYRILSSMNKREFPIFSNNFLISVPELASFVHLPVGAGNSGVKYAQPSLSQSNIPW